MGPLPSPRKTSFFSKAQQRPKQPCPCPVREPGKSRFLLTPPPTLGDPGKATQAWICGSPLRAELFKYMNMKGSFQESCGLGATRGGAGLEGKAMDPNAGHLP